MYVNIGNAIPKIMYISQYLFAYISGSGCFDNSDILSLLMIIMHQVTILK